MRSGDWSGEPEARRDLAVWLRDHDMPQEPLEMDGVLGMATAEPPTLTFDAATGLVERAELDWVVDTRGYGPLRILHFRLTIEPAADGSPRILASILGPRRNT